MDFLEIMDFFAFDLDAATAYLSGYQEAQEATLSEVGLESCGSIGIRIPSKTIMLAIALSER